jgi:hypothetical protein
VSGQVVAEAAVCFPPRPAATGNALHAGQRAVFGQRAARARAAPAAAGQTRLRHLITYFPSAQVKPPFRDAKVRSTTAPGTIGTGNHQIPAGPPGFLPTGLGGPAWLSVTCRAPLCHSSLYVAQAFFAALRAAGFSRPDPVTPHVVRISFGLLSSVTRTGAGPRRKLIQPAQSGA